MTGRAEQVTEVIFHNTQQIGDFEIHHLLINDHWQKYMLDGREIYEAFDSYSHHFLTKILFVSSIQISFFQFSAKMFSFIEI